METTPIHGASYLLKGFRWLLKPGIRRYVWIPLIINTLLFAVAISWLIGMLDEWMVQIEGWLPAWLGFLSGFLWLLAAVVMVVVVALTFTFIANLIAAPFNGFLSEAVVKKVTGQSVDSGRTLMAEIIHSFGRELAKLGFYLPRALLVLILSFIPFTSPFAPFLWMLFGAWMMSVQYLDYPMDNQGVSFAKMQQKMSKKRSLSLGFGGLTTALLTIPVINFLLMPAAVIGASLMWLEHFSDEQQ